jgi:hypothetical protein
MGAAAWLLTLVLAGPAAAQIGVNLKVESSRFLLHEAVPATVIIRNMTGGLLKFGTGPDDATLRLKVERHKGRVLPDRDGESPMAGLSLMPGETREVSFNLARFVDLPETGPYQALASVQWHDTSFESGRIIFDVHKGVPLRTLTGGVATEPGVVRTYTLKSLQRDLTDCLYLAIGDPADESLYGLFPLGPFTRSPEPDCRFDEAGNLHLLFRAAGGSFVYTAFTPYGVRLAGETYRLTPTSNIRLLTQPSGQVAVEAVEMRAVTAATNTAVLPGSGRGP